MTPEQQALKAVEKASREVVRVHKGAIYWDGPSFRSLRDALRDLDRVREEAAEPHTPLCCGGRRASCAAPKKGAPDAC